MTLLAINWAFTLLVMGVGMGVVFVLLIVLIWVINLQTAIIHAKDNNKKSVKTEPVVTTDTHPTPHEQAAIAMAMHLYFDAHDEEPHVITIEEVERRYSPWSSKIYSMRNFTK